MAASDLICLESKMPRILSTNTRQRTTDICLMVTHSTTSLWENSTYYPCVFLDTQMVGKISSGLGSGWSGVPLKYFKTRRSVTWFHPDVLNAVL